MSKKARVRFTVYLPDDLGERAKAAGINLSRTLRDAVENELRADGEPAPSVTVDRVGDSVELHVSLPVEALRGRLS
jgi:hypothetical protein